MEKNFTGSSCTINYQLVGEGQPVLLIHGFGEDHSIWENQIIFLKDFCKLLVPDLPGTGKSRLVKGDQESIEDYAACLYELLLHEKMEQVTVLGHSMGGYIALALIEKYASLFAAFGLINSTAFADNEEKIETRKKGIAFIQQHGAFAFLKSTIPNLFSEASKLKQPTLTNELIEKGKDFTADTLVRYYEAMMKRPDRTAVLKNATVPVLFIIGSDDKAAPLKDLSQQIHLPAVSFIHILKHVGHMSMLEASDELNERMLGFINR